MRSSSYVAMNYMEVVHYPRPPNPTDNLRGGILDILNNTGDQLRALVHNHIRERLVHHRAIIAGLDPSDKETISEVVRGQILKIGHQNHLRYWDEILPWVLFAYWESSGKGEMDFLLFI
jgi:hypothetical protein